MTICEAALGLEGIGPARAGVDVAAKSVYVAGRNLVFGLTLLARLPVLGCAPSDPPKRGCCRLCDERAGVQRERNYDARRNCEVLQYPKRFRFHPAGRWLQG